MPSIISIFFFCVGFSLTSAQVYNGNTHTLRTPNANWFDQIIDLVNEPYKNNPTKHFGFLTVYAMPSVGTYGKDYLVPVHLKSALLLWNADVGTVWTLPAGQRVETSSLYVDMFAGNAEVELREGGRPEAMKRVYDAAKGNWSKALGSTNPSDPLVPDTLAHGFAPYRAAIIGRGITPESDDYVYEITRVLSSNAMGIIGFQASSHKFRTNFADNYLFSRVDDNEYALYESLALFLSTVGITKVTVWGCDNPAQQDVLNIALKPAAAGHDIALTVGLMIEPRNENYKPNVDDVAEWVSALQKAWTSESQYHVSLFSEHAANCPVFDFMSFAYNYIISQQQFWAGGHLDDLIVDYTTHYVPAVIDTNSAYRHSNPFDGMYGLKKQVTFPLFTTYKSFFTNTIKANPSYLEFYMRSALDHSEPISDDMAYMLDAAWSMMLVGNSVNSKFGVNYSSKNIHDETALLSFNGLTGTVSMPNRDRLRTWTVQVAKRPSASCSQAKVACSGALLLNNDGLDNSALLADIVACVDGTYDWSSSLPSLATHGTIYDAALSAPLNYFYGCGQSLPNIATVIGCFSGTYYHPGAGSCVQCDPGSASGAVFTPSKHLFCPKCLAGQNRSRAGGVTCIRCEPGMYSDTPGTANCKVCPPGSHTDLEHPNNYPRDFLRGGPRQCTLCPAGTYTNTHGWAYCKVCPTGKYQNGVGHTACSECPGERTTLHEGATSESSCVCGVGSFLSPHSSNTCLNCTDDFPEGSLTKCSGGLAVPRVRPGYMTLVDSTVVYRCRSAKSSLRFTPCADERPVGENKCLQGATGIACAFCPDDKIWHAQSGFCSECEDFPMVLFITLLVLFFFVLVYKVTPIEAEFTEASINQEVALNLVSVPIAQVLDFLQMQAIWGRSAIPWPKSMQRIFTGLATLFDLSAFHIPCIWGHGDEESDARDQILALNLLPLAIMIPLWLVCIPSAVSKTAVKLRMPDPVKASGLFTSLIHCFFTTICSWSTVLVFATFRHPKTHGLHGKEEESLVAFPYILASSNAAHSLHVIGYIFLGIWGAGTLLYMNTMTFMLTFSQDQLFHRTMLPITSKYRKHFVWWPAFEMYVKFFATLSLAFYDEAGKQMQVLIGCYLVHFVVLCKNCPYRFLRHNFTEAVFSLSKLTIVFFGVTYTSFTGEAQGEAGAEEAQGIIYYILILCYAQFLFFTITGLVMYCGRNVKNTAHPTFDAFTLMFVRDIGMKYMVPTQRPIGEIIPDLTGDALISKKEEDKRQEEKAKLVKSTDSGEKSAAQIQQEEHMWKIGIQRKNELIDQDCKFITDKITPGKMKAPFQSLIASQKGMVSHFVNNEKSMVKLKMEEQSGLIKELLA